MTQRRRRWLRRRPPLRRYRAFLAARREEYEPRAEAAEALYATEDRLGAFVAVG